MEWSRRAQFTMYGAWLPSRQTICLTTLSLDLVEPRTGSANIMLHLAHVLLWRHHDALLLTRSIFRCGPRSTLVLLVGSLPSANGARMLLRTTARVHIRYRRACNTGESRPMMG
eukprot:4343801-Pleurochrysis_carterae.AAC.2